MHVSGEYGYEHDRLRLGQGRRATLGQARRSRPAPEGLGRPASSGQVRALLDMVAAAELPPLDPDRLGSDERALVDEAAAVLVAENGLAATEALDALRLLACTDQQDLADVARAVVADATEREQSAARSSD